MPIKVKDKDIINVKVQNIYATKIAVGEKIVERELRSIKLDFSGAREKIDYAYMTYTVPDTGDTKTVCNPEGEDRLRDGFSTRLPKNSIVNISAMWSETRPYYPPYFNIYIVVNGIKRLLCYDTACSFKLEENSVIYFEKTAVHKLTINLKQIPSQNGEFDKDEPPLVVEAQFKNKVPVDGSEYGFGYEDEWNKKIGIYCAESGYENQEDYILNRNGRYFYYIEEFEPIQELTIKEPKENHEYVITYNPGSQERQYNENNEWIIDEDWEVTIEDIYVPAPTQKSNIKIEFESQVHKTDIQWNYYVDGINRSDYFTLSEEVRSILVKADQDSEFWFTIESSEHLGNCGWYIIPSTDIIDNKFYLTQKEYTIYIFFTAS